MPIDIVGVYVSEDGQHTLDIKTSNSSEGEFYGVFTIKDMPVDAFEYPPFIGAWDYTDDTLLAGIAFKVRYRPEGREFVIYDCWTGSITVERELIMSGVRSHTYMSDGRDLFSFDSVRFIKQSA